MFARWNLPKKAVEAIKSVRPGTKFKGGKSASEWKADTKFQKAKIKLDQTLEKTDKSLEKLKKTVQKTKHYYAPKDF